MKKIQSPKYHWATIKLVCLLTTFQNSLILFFKDVEIKNIWTNLIDDDRDAMAIILWKQCEKYKDQDIKDFQLKK